jgi:hypothetical protein|tara:strand:+ start:448 stop:657 length:210 start_codon:yes stop_codon:yes gene_type:complete
MIETIATIDIIESALSKIEDDKVADAHQVLTTYKTKLQNEVDSFEKWATNQSDIDTSIQLEIDSTTESQ